MCRVLNSLTVFAWLWTSICEIYKKTSNLHDAVRDVLKTEEEKYRNSANKARAALDKLQVPHLYASTPDYLTYPGASPSGDTISFESSHIPAAAYFVNEGIFGGAGQDTISLG